MNINKQTIPQVLIIKEGEGMKLVIMKGKEAVFDSLEGVSRA